MSGETGSADGEKAASTPETLISGTVAALRADKATDADLLAILEAHILTMTPAAAAVANAAAAIAALAGSRAEEPAHGATDHA